MKKGTLSNRRKPSFLTVTAILLVVSTLICYLIASNGGSTKIQRMTVPGENGLSMSYELWTPKEATTENKLPLCIVWPGRSSNSHQLDAWAMEFSRHGYVAVTVDWNGNGETDVMHGTESYVRSLMDSVLQIPYVDTEKVVVLGNSAGNSAATLAAQLYSENIVAYIDDVHPRLLAEDLPSCNMMIIEAASDQYVRTFIGDQDTVYATITEAWALDASVEEGKFYGSAEDGTLRQFVVTPTIHQISAMNAWGIRAACDFLKVFLPQKEVGGLIMGWYQIAQLFAYACIILFVAALGSWMYDNIPYFHAIGNAPTQNKGLRGKALTRNVLIAMLIPLVTFFPVSWAFHNAEFLNSIFPSRNLRGILGWLVTNAVITLIMIAVSASRRKKAGHPMQASDFGFAGEGEKLQPWKIGRAFIMGAVVVFILYAWVALVEKVFGINYQIWNLLNISAIPANRLFKAIPFVCCVMVIMFASNIGMNTTRRLADTGNAKRDLVVQIVLNVFVAAGVITLLLLAQYGIGWATGHYLMPQLENVGGGTSSGSLDFSFGFPMIMGFSAGISTYFYRKTNNIWIGLFVSSILAGFVGVVGATFITGHAVM